MTYQLLHLEKQNAVGILRFNRPAQLNAFDIAMIQEAPAALRELLADDSVRVVVITGNGKGFCAGADVNLLQELGSTGDIARGKTLVSTGSEMVEMIHAADKPVIAAINGPAAGGGAGIALACDIRVMAQSASLGFTFIRIGLHPDLGCTYFLPRLVGPAKAAELMMTGEMIAAEEALRLGMVNHVVPDAELMATTLKLAAAIAEKSPLALRLLKKGMHQTLEQSLDAMLKYEIYSQMLCFESKEAAEAIQKFLSARKK
jgi:2-(1,2-epoxy-1,2-dihydrophenyl)acetyl-CoA isomerase